MLASGILLVLGFGGGAGPVLGQMTISGSVTGSVVDPTGNVVGGAVVTLTNEKTGDSHRVNTNDTGDFTFLAVQPGTFSLKVERTGFKIRRQTGLTLSANQRLSAGALQLELGAVSETISVEAQAVTVQTTSAEQSAVITTKQIESLTARGRDVVSLLRTIPGVGYQADQDSVGGNFGTGSPSIAGAGSAANVIAVDGVISNDLGSPNVFSSVTTLDAIGEVKVVTSSYQAEYASNGGAVVQVVSRSGGSQFHGTAYEFLRNEALNANNFFNNRTAVARPRYRYNTLGATISGPIYIPGAFNRDRNRLFGFYNIEQWTIKNPGNRQQYTMPSALERTGDFSQTLDTNNRLITINDPNSKVPFSSNRIPANLLNSNGLALMKTLPLPNFEFPAITGNTYNYQIQEVFDQPKRSQLFKVDYVPSEKDRLYVRGKTWMSRQQGYAVSSGATPVGFFGQCYCFTESGISIGGTHTFSPNIVMEYSAGARNNHEAWYPYGSENEIDKVLRSKIGFTAGQWFPQANPQGIIPRFSFGGVQSAPNVSFDDRFLTGGADTQFTVNDSVTIIHRAHTFKLGFDWNRVREYEGERSVFSGTFAFARDVNNPFDSNYAFSNAALGNFQQYTESSARYGANERQTIFNWFAQDNWKVNRHLTLDYGVRFTWFNQMYPKNAGQQSAFALERYKASDAPPLYRPALGPNNVRMAQNPLTGQLLPAAYIGLYVPGIGNPAPGGVTSGDSSYPRGFIDQNPVMVGPRLGIAYDPFGKGKTSIRAGGAWLFTPRISRWSATTNNPPAILTPITYYGNINTFVQTAGVAAPQNTNGYNRAATVSDAYSFSFGIQQDVGMSTIVDVSYVGNLGKHNAANLALNTLPYGARFAASARDLTTASSPLPDIFLKPMPGYNNITLADNAYSSNYHSMLVSVNRRFSKGFQFGLAYTFSKAMDYSGIPLYNNLRIWSYGLQGGDTPHNLAINFTYATPKLSKRLPNPLVHHVFDDWQLSGIAQFVSGTPSSIGFTTVDSVDLTGGGDGQRVNIVGNPKSVEQSFDHWFNGAAFARPGLLDHGNAAKNSIRGPGVNNFDLALSKTFPIKSEARNFQLRWEAYNAFNHTQYSGVNTTARFDATGAQTNTLFGQITSTRTARVMQGSLRFTF